MKSLKRIFPTLLTTMALALTACGSAGNSSQQTPEPSASEEAVAACKAVTAEVSFPLTIKHALGETVIDAKPERIATVGWANHEVPLALGVVPVGMSKATWGDDDQDGVLPWVADKLQELGAETPALFDETDGLPFEAISETKPDVILAAYSGLTAEDYETLSKIAPVVAYPDIAWGTSMDCMIRMNSQAMGMAMDGEQLVTDLDNKISETLNAHAKLKDAKVLFTGFSADADLSKISFYTLNDPRAGFLAEAGLGVPQVVQEETDANPTSFFAEVSSEEVDRFLDVDVIVAYGPAEDNESLISMLQADPLLNKMPAVSGGHVARIGNSNPLAASANPSPLSIGWGLDEYFTLIENGLE